jgi:lysophospholipase L1-like esterase
VKKILLALALLFPLSSMAVTICSGGDSITGAAKRLRTQLYNQVETRQFVGTKYDGRWNHDGVAGDSTADLVARIDTIPPCDIALVLIGTNDWGQGITMDGTLTRLQRIVNELSSRGTSVYLLKLLPRFDNLGLNDWNAAINDRITNEITGATIINTWAALMQSEYPLTLLLYDGLHPTALGYDELALYIGPRIP